MPKVIFVSHEGEEYAVDAQTGISLMSAAIENGVPGIDADCGGGCACGTCHVIVDAEWSDKIAEIGAIEDSMLGMNPERDERSRLSCQLELTEEYDGLRVCVPAYQM